MISANTSVPAPPKQWKHWCKLGRLKRRQRYWGAPNRNDWFVALEGHSRYWRINDLGEFQASCATSSFDRWATSVMATFPIPKTEAEFLRVIRSVSPKYVWCSGCGCLMPVVLNRQLWTSVGCPRCGAASTFGPGSANFKFEGATLDEYWKRHPLSTQSFIVTLEAP